MPSYLRAIKSMSLRVKEKLDKLLHRRDKHEDGSPDGHSALPNGGTGDGAAPSPAIARTSADKAAAAAAGSQQQHVRNKSSLHDYVQKKRRSMSRSRPTSRSNADTPIPAAQTSHLPEPPREAREAAPRITSPSHVIEYLNTLNFDDDSPYAAPRDSEGSDRPRTSRSIPIGNSRDPYQEHIANHNLTRDETVLAGGTEDVHAIRKVMEKDRVDIKQRGVSGEFRRSIGNGLDQRRSIDERSRELTVPKANDPPNFSRPGRASFDQEQREPVIIPQRTASLARGPPPATDIPPPPPQPLRRVQDEDDLQNLLHTSGARTTPTTLHALNNVSRKDVPPEDFLVEDSATPIPLTDVVDLTHTEDTTIHETVAPAVTHDIVRVDTHEIITEEITREIHNHDIFHRILPILDIEVLPPRHFIRTPAGGLYEISEEQIPGGVEQNIRLQQILQNAVNANISLLTAGHTTASPPSGLRNFTARKFQGREGDEKEFISEDGKSVYTERTWVHPPTLQIGGEETGQTVGFRFGEERRQRPEFRDRTATEEVVSQAAEASLIARRPVEGLGRSPGGGEWI